MNSPFIFGKVADGKGFANRQNDIERLSENFRNGINTILISPRRWGKSSLVRKVFKNFESEKKYHFCFLDLFNIRSENEFYESLAKAVLKSTSGKLEEWMKMTKDFLSGITPKISFSVDSYTDFDISFESQQKSLPEKVLDLANKIAEKKKITLIICIDEFQNIEYYNDPLGFQKQLRASWQHHQNVVYCLYGSKRHMMTNLFNSKSMPFYKFGDLFYLDKIQSREFAQFIVQRFKSTKKKIPKSIAEKIVEKMEAHSYYVQQLAYIVWQKTETETSEEIFQNALDDLIGRNLLLFQRDFENLSNIQVNLLKALTAEIDKGITSRETIEKYKLNSSASALRALEALEKKEIIDRFNRKIEFIDPAFKLWLKYLFK